MGYCSATDYVDNAIAMADAAVKRALELRGVQVNRPLDEFERAQIDEVMKQFVHEIADKAREDDWDCQDASRYLGRFPEQIDPDGNFGDYYAGQAHDGR